MALMRAWFMGNAAIRKAITRPRAIGTERLDSRHSRVAPVSISSRYTTVITASAPSSRLT